MIPLPDLELCVSIDPLKRITKLANVRLICKTLEADLLMPYQPADLRFATQVYASAKMARKVPAPIEEFLDSSNLNVWGRDRLKTPTSLSLLVPRYFSWNASSTKPTREASRLAIDRSSLEPVKYTFASLEHRSELVKRWRNLTFVYSVVEAGRTGGRREEFRIFATKRALEDPFKPLYDNVMDVMANWGRLLESESDQLSSSSPPRTIIRKITTGPSSAEP